MAPAVTARRTLPLVIAMLAATAGCLTSGGDAPAPPPAGTSPAVLATASLSPDESDEYITSLCLAGTTLWVGTEHAVYEVAYQTTPPALSVVSRHAAAVDDGRINEIRADGDAVLVASAEGFSRRSSGEWLRNETGNVNDVMRVGDDLWAATNNGLEVLRSGSREWRPLEVASVTDYFPTKKMTCMATDATASVWVGTEFGLHHFDLRGQTELKARLAAVSSGAAPAGAPGVGPLWKRWFGAYQNPSGGLLSTVEGNCGLEGNQIKRIRWDAGGKRFAVCTERGVNFFDGASWTSLTGTGDVFTMNEAGELVRRQVEGSVAIPTPEAYDVAVDGPVVWMATRSGLARVGPDRSTTLVTLEHGLPSNGVRALALDAGRGVLFVGTENGLGVVAAR